MRNPLVLCPDLDLTEFSEPDVFNYSTLLLSEKGDALYVGAREAIFELSKKNVSVRNNKVTLVNTEMFGTRENPVKTLAHAGNSDISYKHLKGPLERCWKPHKEVHT